MDQTSIGVYSVSRSSHPTHPDLKSVTAVAIRDLLERKPTLLTLNLGGAKFATDTVINGLAVGAPHTRIYRR